VTVQGIGVDITDVHRMARLLSAHGDRFARKWFHADEIAACARRRDPARAYAEHFAVKEAVWKALGAAGWDGPLAWRSIIYRPGTATPVELQGRAGALADRVGTGLAVHAVVTSRAHYALATVLVTAVTSPVMVRSQPR